MPKSPPDDRQVAPAATPKWRGVLDPLILIVVGGRVRVCEAVAFLADAEHAGGLDVPWLEESACPGVAGASVDWVERLGFWVLTVVVEVVSVAEYRDGARAVLGIAAGADEAAWRVRLVTVGPVAGQSLAGVSLERGYKASRAVSASTFERLRVGDDQEIGRLDLLCAGPLGVVGLPVFEVAWRGDAEAADCGLSEPGRWAAGVAEF